MCTDEVSRTNADTIIIKKSKNFKHETKWKKETESESESESENISLLKRETDDSNLK